MPPPRNASTYNARPPTREREELAKRCLERSKNALLEFQKKSAALGVAVAPMTAPDGTTVAYDHFDGVRVAPPVENAVIKLVEENAPAMPSPKPRLPLSPKNTTTTWKTGFLEPKKTDARGRFVAPPPAPPSAKKISWKAPPPTSPSKDVAAMPTPTLVGALEAVVMVSPRMRRGCVWMPLHFPDSKTNHLTNDAGDAVTSTGEYKVCAVRVEALETAPITV